MSHWIFSCRDVTQKVSESMDRDMAFHQRLAIRAHLLVCKFCSRYRKQLLFIRAALQLQEEREGSHDPTIRLTPEARRRIKDGLSLHSGKI